MSSYTSIPSCDDGAFTFDDSTARASTSLTGDGSRRRLRPVLAFTFAAAVVVGVVAAGRPAFGRTVATSVAFDEDPMHVGTHNNDTVDTYTEREAYEIMRSHNGTMTCDEVTVRADSRDLNRRTYVVDRWCPSRPRVCVCARVILLFDRLAKESDHAFGAPRTRPRPCACH